MTEIHLSPFTFMGYPFRMRYEVKRGEGARFVVESEGKVPKAVGEAAESYFREFVEAMQRAAFSNASAPTPPKGELNLSIALPPSEDGGRQR